MRSIQRAIIAQLWTNGETGNWFRHRWFDVYAGCDRPIGGPPAADGARIDGRLAFQSAHRVMGIGKRDHIKPFVVAKNLTADTSREPAVDGISEILGDAVAVSIGAGVMRVIEIGNRS